jgi:hypothetical protein
MKSTVALALVSAFFLLLPCVAARAESLRVPDSQADNAAAESPTAESSSVCDSPATCPSNIADATDRPSVADDAILNLLLQYHVDSFAPDVTLLTRSIASSLFAPVVSSIGRLPLAGAELAGLSLVKSRTSETDNSFAKHRAGTAAGSTRGVYAESLR